MTEVYMGGKFIGKAVGGLEIYEVYETERWSGKYVLPDGSAVEARDVRIRTQFVTYGPEDIDHLLFIGAIKKEMTKFISVFKTEPTKPVTVRFTEQNPQALWEELFHPCLSCPPYDNRPIVLTTTS